MNFNTAVTRANGQTYHLNRYTNTKANFESVYSLVII